MLEEESENYENTCTCFCIDCIEGNHCGGVFTDTDDEGNEEVIGICNNPDALMELLMEDQERLLDWGDEDEEDDDYDDEDEW